MPRTWAIAVSRSAGDGVNTPDSTTSKNNTVSYNRLVNMNQVLSGDGGGLYTLGQMPTSTVSSNYVVNSLDGIYPDQGSSHITFNNNVFQSVTGDFFYLWSPTAMPYITATNSYTDNGNFTLAGGTTSGGTTTNSNNDSFPERPSPTPFRRTPPPPAS